LAVATNFARIEDPLPAARASCFTEFAKSVDSADDDSFHASVKAGLPQFTRSVVDSSSLVRFRAIEAFSSVIRRLGNDVNRYSSALFPAILLLRLDSDHQVAEAAGTIFQGYFQTSQQECRAISLLRRDLCRHLRQLFFYLKSSTADSNWGRLCDAALLLTLRLYVVGGQSRNILTAIGHFPIQQWLNTETYCSAMSETGRTAAHHYIRIAIANDLLKEDDVAEPTVNECQLTLKQVSICIQSDEGNHTVLSTVNAKIDKSQMTVNCGLKSDQDWSATPSSFNIA
jgi:hypothetical protein